MKIVRISYNEMQDVFSKILVKNKFTNEKAKTCARIFAENSMEGIYSHGVYRFPRFIDYIQKGFVLPDAEPQLIHSAGALEQWEGNLGPGPLNAEYCTRRAMELAHKIGMGCIAIANTNHWMRGGTYGWQAAKNGYAFMGWTNTEANMPAWGAKNSRLGNNPMVIAVPMGKEAIVLDFAMTQFSYGKMEAAHLEGENLSFPGGYNAKGELSTNPAEILETRRALPIGYWKGAGLSLLLDIMATVLSGGLSTGQLSAREAEYGVSQVFIAFDLQKLKNFSSLEGVLSEIIADIKKSVPDESGSEIRFPGERVLRTRKNNLKNGIPVSNKVWKEILELF